MHQTSLLKSVTSCIERYGLFSMDSLLYLALSGGSDSVALLRSLLALGYKPRALHCNFHLRGEESDEDEAFVRSLCAGLSVPLECRHFDTLSYAQTKGISVEMAARELRYQWFAEIREANPSACIAIAHNAQDGVETFLLNLTHGTGLRGLSGMPYKRVDGIVRPLMTTRPETIRLYLEELGQMWREDSSNRDEVYQRNYIRHSLIPAFERLNPNFIVGLLQTIEHLRGVEAYYLKAIENEKHRVLDGDGQIDIERLLTSDDMPTLLFELLRPYAFTSAQILEIASKLEALPSGRRFDSPTHSLIRSWSKLLILPRGEEEGRLSLCFSPSECTELQLPGGASLRAEFILTEHIKDFPNFKVLSLNSNEVLFDWETLQEQGSCLILRYPREGDRIQPLGMERGSKLLSRVFIDKQVPLPERSHIPLVCLSDDTPLWLVGLCSAHTYRLRSSSRLALCLRYIPRSK